MDREVSWGQTIAASILSIIIFFLLAYVVAQIVKSLFLLWARWFVPARFGGAGEVDNPSVLGSSVRAVTYSGLSAYGALAGSLKICPRARVKTVAVVFALAIVAFAGLFVFGGYMTGDVAIPLTMLLLIAAPALFVAYWAWHEEL